MARLKKHPGRKRRIGGWVLLSLAVLVAGVWAQSRWWDVQYINRYWGVSCDSGVFDWWNSEVDVSQFVLLGWQLDRHFPAGAIMPLAFRVNTPPEDVHGHYGVFSHWRGQFYNLYELRLWPLPLLLTAAGVPVLRSGVMARRRAKAGACPACGYDKRGIPADAVCPECGKR